MRAAASAAARWEEASGSYSTASGTALPRAPARAPGHLAAIGPTAGCLLGEAAEPSGMAGEVGI